MSTSSPNDCTQFAVLLFTDICDSTALKGRHGALAYKAAAELHNRLFEEIAAQEKLVLIKNTGDGYFARSTSVAAVVRFALRFQHGMRTMAWPAFPLTTRVGIHAGEVADITTLGQADVLAPAADLVARVMSLAVGGQVLLTRWPFDEARHFVRQHPAVPDRPEPPALSWLAHGPYLFKGCEDPVEVYEVGAQDVAPLAAPPDGEKAKRAIRAGEEQTLGWRPAIGLEVPGRPGWTLARKIGEGGFGEVWLAEQPKMKARRVFKFCFDDERLRSFKRELTLFRLIRDALGERADIARLYDVKLDAPPFFLESEFAERGNLVEWAEKQGGIGTVPLPRRLDLAARIADAVAAAHSIGILHKDLKPQNVLMQIGKNGEEYPQLTDFGIGALADANALAARSITAAGFTINTLVSSGSGSAMTRLYAPPEQLTGKAFTVQGDVYALGVVLYQLVVGDFNRALAPGWEREIQDELLREDIAECVDGEPARRFPSTAELAERLRTLEARREERRRGHEQLRLAEELKAAQARAVAERARWKRTRRVVAVVSVLAVAALGAGGFASWEASRARQAESLASDRLQDAAKARDAAEGLINEAIYGLRKKLTAVGKVEIMEEMVTGAEAYYKRLPEDLANDETKRHLASLALNRAIIAGALGQDEAYERSTRESLRLTEELAAKHPEDDKLQEEACYAMLNLAYLYYDRADNAQTLAISDAAIARCETSLKRKPGSIWAMRYEALAHGVAGQTFIRNLNKPLDGLARFQTASEIAVRMRTSGGETEDVCEVEGFIHYGNANIASHTKQHDREVSEFEASAASFARALELGGDSALLREMYFGALHHAGAQARRAALDKGDTAGVRKCEERVRQALEGRRKLVELEPGRAEWWRDLAHSYSTVADYASDPPAALAQYRESLRCRDEAVKRQPTRPLLFEERSGTCSYVANQLLHLDPPETKEALRFTVQAFDDWKHAIEMTEGAPISRHTLKGDIDRLGKLAGADAAGLLPVLVQVRSLIEPLLPKVKGENDLAVCYGLLLRHQRDALVKLGRTAETAEIDAKLGSAPGQATTRAAVTRDHASELFNALRKAPPAQKAALLAEFETFTRENLKWLEAHRTELPPYDYAYTRGVCVSLFGTALMEAEKPSAAEPMLREAVQFRHEAATKAPNERDAQERQWDAADSQGKLAGALAKLGRLEESRQNRREAAEAQEKVARQLPAANRFRQAGNSWRGYAESLPPAADAEGLNAWNHGAELAREAVQRAKTDGGGDTAEKMAVYSEAAWVLNGAATCWLKTKREADAEAALREAVGAAEASNTSANTNPEERRAFQISNLRYNLALALLRNGHPAEARQEADKLEAEVHAAEQKFPDGGVAQHGLGWVKDVRSRL